MLIAKKSLGQNFLKDRGVIQKIVEAGDLNEGDVVFEIGPGTGALTQELLEKNVKVIAIETDRELFELLSIKFENQILSGQLNLIKEDVKNFDPNRLPKKYKLIANIPFYITGEIIRKFLSTDNQPRQIVLVIQKEVAERIVSRDSKESILSIAVKVYGTPKYIGKIKKESFSPKPKVDSAIISISNISKSNFEKLSEESFFEIVKAGFQHKRKKLVKNLKGLVNKEDLEKMVGADTRAEEVGLDKWLEITDRRI